MSEKVLSVFIDESGDFGEITERPAYYLVTLLFHDQKNEIASNVKSEVYFEDINSLGASASEIEKLATITLVQEKGEGKVIYTALGEFILLDEKKDKEELIKELEAEIKKIKFEVERSEKILSNPRFVEKAPKELVETEKGKLENNKKILETLLNKLDKVK